MARPSRRPTTVDEYIARYPDAVQRILREIRKVVREAAPDAEERISYGMAGYYLNGHGLVWFGAWQKHIGFYPGAAGIPGIEKEAAAYPQTRGGIRFPYNRLIPYGLIRRMIEFHVAALREQSRPGVASR